MNAQAQAEAIARELDARDSASQALGITLEESVRATPHENDGAQGHGERPRPRPRRPIFTLADSTFAFACNSHGHVTVAQGATIEFLGPAGSATC